MEELEFDDKAAAKEAKRILLSYPKIKRRYKNLAPSIQSPSWSDDKTSGGFKNNVNYEKWIEMGIKAEEIEDGVEKVLGFSIDWYDILHYRYIKTGNQFSQTHYAKKAQYEKTQYYENLNMAFMAFAEVYKKGKIYKDL